MSNNSQSNETTNQRNETTNQCNETTNPKIMKYINQLSELEKKTLEIARDHLGTSFNIEKSIGFIQWLQSQ